MLQTLFAPMATRRDRWSTMPGPTPGVRRDERARNKFRASFPFAGRWVYLGLYANEREALQAALAARSLPMPMRRRLAWCRTARGRRELLAKMLRAAGKPEVREPEPGRLGAPLTLPTSKGGPFIAVVWDGTRDVYVGRFPTKELAEQAKREARHRRSLGVPIVPPLEDFQ